MEEDPAYSPLKKENDSKSSEIKFWFTLLIIWFGEIIQLIALILSLYYGLSQEPLFVYLRILAIIILANGLMGKWRWGLFLDLYFYLFQFLPAAFYTSVLLYSFTGFQFFYYQAISMYPEFSPSTAVFLFFAAIVVTIFYHLVAGWATTKYKKLRRMNQALF